MVGEMTDNKGKLFPKDNLISLSYKSTLTKLE